ncbi:hypothetical protein LZC95_22100 [Pendulispora brunnea]|uniref:Uncharacterized protein n=1 Tax=Pendulispora brunnea TaxID=2905690 RepID=A0ABZ2KN77_9BACT
MTWRRSEKLAPARGTIRVAAYLTVLAAAAGVFCAHKAHAGISETTLQLGRDMMPLSEYIKEPTAMTLNGERMTLGTGTSKKSVHDVLDAYETYCRSSEGSLGKEWADLAAQSPDKLNVKSRLGGSFDMGVYRSEKTDEGAVLCFMRGQNSSKTMMESLQMFEQTKDLGSLGKMRYVYVKDAGGGRARVFTAWTDDRFRIDSFAPEGTADAAGSDPVGIPRPPQSQRLMSAQIAGSPFGAHVYRSAQSEDQVRAFYDAEMSKAGWTPIGWGENNDIDQAKHRIYMKGGIQIVLANGRDEDGTLVSLGELGARPEEFTPPYEEK